MSEWQPIETARKTFESVLLFDKTEGPVVGSWEKYTSGLGNWISDLYNAKDERVVLEPTHWMPLPDPPKAEPR